jgi:ferritin-like metal-binding protein YciE
MSNMESLADVMRDELKDIDDAEKQRLKALPKLAKKASNAQLRQAPE